MGQAVHEIKLNDRNVEPISFSIGGEQFDFRPPKLFVFMEAVTESRKNGGSEEEMFGIVVDLLKNALPDEQSSRLMERLRDPDDLLDVDHLVEIFQTLTQAVADRPTLSTPGD